MNNARFPCVIVSTALKRLVVVDFDQSRAWILYSERRSYVGITHMSFHLIFSTLVEIQKVNYKSNICKITYAIN